MLKDFVSVFPFLPKLNPDVRHYITVLDLYGLIGGSSLQIMSAVQFTVFRWHHFFVVSMKVFPAENFTIPFGYL